MSSTSPSTSTTRFVPLDASGSNWHTWQTTAKIELKRQKMWKYVDPTYPLPTKYSESDQKKIDSGTDPDTLKVAKSYTEWFEECDVATGALMNLLDPVHADLVDAQTSPRGCWTALITRFANRSAQGISLLQTRLAALRFTEDESAPISEFLAKFDGLVMDLRRASHPLSDVETCSRIALAMPLSLQATISSLQEGSNASNPAHWYASLTTTWERLQSIRISEPTYAAKRAATTSRDTCHVCSRPGHFARDCPTLTPEERAQRQERARRRKEGRWNTKRTDGATNTTAMKADSRDELAAQLKSIQAKLAALDMGSAHGDATSSGYDTHAKVTILCASSSSLAETPSLDSVLCDDLGRVVLKAGGGKIPASHAAVDSGASRHCAAERNLFTNYCVLDPPRKVYLGDDRFILAVGEGDLRVWIDNPLGERVGLTFTHTLHVPDLACTLISIRQLTRDVRPPVHAVFKGDSCEVRNDSGLIFCAEADDTANGLYTLHLKTSPRPPARTPVLALAAFTATKSVAALDPHVAHARFGHLNCNDLNALVRKQLVSRFSLSNRPHQSDPCEPCLLAKAHKLPFSARSARSSVPLDLVHTDLCGPMDTEALGGYKYFVTFRDDCTRLLCVYLLKKKSDTFERYKEFRAWAERSSGRKIKCLMSDQGREFMSGAFDCFLRDNGTVNQTSAPYTPEQNGVAERVNRDLLSIMRAVLQDSGLARRFWGEAILYAGYTLNYRPNSAIDGGLPITAWTGAVPDVSHLRVFGCDTFVLIQPDSQRTKSGPTATKCILTGYTGSGYRCWDPKALRFRVSRHVVCVERNRVHDASAPTPPPSEDELRQAFDMTQVTRPSDSTPQAPNVETTPTLAPRGGSATQDEAEDLGELDEPDVGHEEEMAPGGEVEVAPPDPPALRRSERVPVPNRRYAQVTLATAGERPIVPTSFAEAMASPDAILWAGACNKEINTLIRMGTFTYVAALPTTRKALKGMFVFAIKVDGTYKARLVIKGCAQRWGQDYSETFSPVARSASLRLVAAIAVRDSLTLYAADFTAAFLNGPLDEEIYMEPPDGWIAPAGKERWYLKLVRSLYGLKQAGRVWYLCLTRALDELGFTRLEADNCVYMRCRPDSGMILIAVHVDDLTGAARSDEVWNSFCDELNAKYQLKNLGRAKEMLGLEIAQDLKAGTVSITQTRYIEDLAKRFEVYDLPPTSLPLAPREKLSVKQCPTSDVERSAMREKPYLALVGALLFVSCQTRPEISHAVCVLARFSSNPALEHWEALLGVLRYLRHSSSIGLNYSRTGSPSLSIYSDADWGMCPDTFRSTTGWLVMLSGGPISWSSKRQSVVAQSTMEAEYIAMSMACREGYWVCSWLAEVDGIEGRPPPTPLFCDNKAAMSVTQNPESHQMTKHIAIRYHYVRDQVQLGEYTVYHVPSRDQLADFLTKPTTKDVFMRCRNGAGIH